MNKLKWHAGQFVGTWFGRVKGLVFVDQDTCNTVSLPIREALKVAWAELENYRYEALRLKGLLEKRNSDASKLTGELEQVRKELKRYQDLEKITRMHVDLPDGVEVSEIAKRFNDPRHRPFASGGLVGQPPTHSAKLTDPVPAPNPGVHFNDGLLTVALLNTATTKPEVVEVPVRCEPAVTRTESYVSSSSYSCSDSGSSSSSSSDSSSSSSNDY